MPTGEDGDQRLVDDPLAIDDDSDRFPISVANPRRARSQAARTLARSAGSHSRIGDVMPLLHRPGPRDTTSGTILRSLETTRRGHSPSTGEVAGGELFGADGVVPVSVGFGDASCSEGLPRRPSCTSGISEIDGLCPGSLSTLFPCGYGCRTGFPRRGPEALAMTSRSRSGSTASLRRPPSSRSNAASIARMFQASGPLVGMTSDSRSNRSPIIWSSRSRTRPPVRSATRVSNPALSTRSRYSSAGPTRPPPGCCHR